MKKSFSKKYPFAALVVCLLALFLGKPVEEFLTEEPSVKEVVLQDDATQKIAAKEGSTQETAVQESYTFRSQKQLTEHFEKHGKEMGFSSEEEYLQNANRVISSPEALHKLEAEDLDDVYYLESSNEFVIVSSDGFIRTYFSPEDGIDYYNRQ